MQIRPALEADSDALFGLMRELAVFEKYIDSFAITPAVVRASGFRKSPPDFYCLVAEEAHQIVGMLVYYFLPYTAQNRPAIYMKELFVAEGWRNRGIGRQLMAALRDVARNHGCGQIKWTVAPWNEAGIRFYARLGAKENHDWLNFDLSV
ncbi:MAG TPA: GNAT family N-acetyltransferase [Rhodanobacteraceae bacterium]